MVNELRNPYIVYFSYAGDRSITQLDNKKIQVDANADLRTVRGIIKEAVSRKDENGQKPDYVMFAYDRNGIDDLDAKTMKALDIKATSIISDMSAKNLRVFNRFENQVYLLNPSKADKKQATEFVVPNDVVLKHKHSFGDDYEWQHHQSNVWDKMRKINGLSDKNDAFNRNHLAKLTDPKRGLTKEDTKEFFSIKNGQRIIPGLMNDSMMGMPAMKTAAYSGYKLFIGDKEVPSVPQHINVTTTSGYVIPLKNVRGDMAKFQIGSDLQTYNTKLSAKAADGVKIANDQITNGDKYNPMYTFDLLDGRESELQILDADEITGKVEMSDVNGEFQINLKENIKEKLISRGYDLPPIIDNISADITGKYMWPSQGNMIGVFNKKDNEVQKEVSPSQAGFITAREPRNGSDEYVVVVAEGALKGVITAKYMDTKDETGVSLGDTIAKDRGIIVAQITGVADAMIDSVSRIYTDTDLNIVGTYVALDADGRTNLSVSNGIHHAEAELGKYNPVKVLAWDPAQKGIDDALLAVANHKITIADMDIHYGTAEKLFPKSEAKAPNPYLLDGTFKNKPNEYGQTSSRPQWSIDYEKRENEIQAKATKLVENYQSAVEEPTVEDLAGDFEASLQDIEKNSIEL